MGCRGYSLSGTLSFPGGNPKAPQPYTLAGLRGNPRTVFDYTNSAFWFKYTIILIIGNPKMVPQIVETPSTKAVENPLVQGCNASQGA